MLPAREHGERRRRFVVFAMELKNRRTARKLVPTCTEGSRKCVFRRCARKNVADFQKNDANDRTGFERSARIVKNKCNEILNKKNSVSIELRLTLWGQWNCF